MIAPILLLAAVTTAVPEADADAAALDDLQILDAVAEGLRSEAEDVFGEVPLGAASTGDDAAPHTTPRHQGRYWWAHRQDGAVLGPQKDALRRSQDTFGLPRSAFVDMPGPRGTGGRITAELLAEDADEAVTDDAAGPGTDPASPITDDAGAKTASGEVQAQASGPAGAEVRMNAARAVAPKSSAPTMRMSMSVPRDAAPAAADAGGALPTPVPPSLLLFASGIGLFGLSRRKA